MIFDLIKGLLYLVLAGESWALLLKKNFNECLAPAILFHSLVCIILAMIFTDLRVGLFLVIIIYLSILIYFLFVKNEIKNYLVLNRLKSGLVIFILFYVILSILSINKQFKHWDEFSHWGMMIKESFRIDKLHYLSDITFFHKDYISSTTMFMYILIKIAGRYSEAYANAAITILMYSMIMPLYSLVWNNKEKKDDIISFLMLAISWLIPIFVYSGNYFTFYRGIIPDYAMGVGLFYCIYLCFNIDEKVSYDIFIFTIALVYFVLMKMTAIAYVPIVFMLYFAYRLQIKNKIVLFIPFLTSVAMFIVLNKYISLFVNFSSIQSYNSISLNDIINVITFNENGISYIKKLFDVYCNGLLGINVLINGSYLVSMIITVGFVLFSSFLKKEYFNRIVLLAIWMFLAYIYNAILYFFLYATRFSETEAMQLAGYTRYMGTFVAAMVYICYMIYMYVTNGLNNYLYRNIVLSGLYIIVVICISNVFLLFCKYYKSKSSDDLDALRKNRYAEAFYQYAPAFMLDEDKSLVHAKRIAEELVPYKEKGKNIVALASQEISYGHSEYNKVFYYLDYKNIRMIYANYYEDINKLMDELKEYDVTVAMDEENEIGVYCQNFSYDTLKLNNINIIK